MRERLKNIRFNATLIEVMVNQTGKLPHGAEISNFIRISEQLNDCADTIEDQALEIINLKVELARYKQSA